MLCICSNQINITQMTEYFDVVYQTPWCRIGPYLVGMLLGYLLYITKGNVRMPRVGLLVDTVKVYFFSYITWDSKRMAE